MEKRALSIAVLGWSVAPFGGGAEWPEFRGPTGDGQVPEGARLPLEWSEESHMAWKTPIHGIGHSTPAVGGSKVWVTTATEDGRRMSVLVLDRESGRILLDRVVFENENPEPLGNSVNSYASPSPVLGVDRAWVHFGSYGTACFDASTLEIVWQRRDLPCRHFRGPGSSPFLFGEYLILTMDGIDRQYLAALNKETGETVWRRDRSTDWDDLDEDGKPKAEGDFRKAYSTPILVEFRDKGPQLIATGARATWAYDPRDGTELWQVRYPGFSNAARPLFGAGRVFINTGYGRAALLGLPLQGGERGDLTGRVEWENDNRIPQRSSPVLVGGLLYLVNDGGVFSCIDPETGETVFSERLEGQYSASPIAWGDRIYLFNEQGGGTVVQAGRQFRVLAENKLDEGMLASPAADGRSLYLRTRSHLYCLRDDG